jgi:hypothetical protein
MSLDAYPLVDSQPDTVDHFVKFVGGSTAVTKVYGPGVTVTYIGTGLVDIVWAENPGTFLGFTHGFQATTAADVKGHTVVAGVYDATTRTVRLNITNASEALHDLAALEWLNLIFKFKRTAV